MAVSDIRPSLRGGGPLRPGDALRDAQSRLEAQLRQLIAGFNAANGVWISEVNLRYLEGGDNPASTRDLVVKVTVAT